MPALKVWVANERLTSTDLNATFASVQLPDGVVASAASTTTTATAITLNAVVEGKASYLAGGRIVTPRAGLYLVSFFGSYGITSGSGTAALTIVGTPFVMDINWTNVMRLAFAQPLILAANTQLTMSFTNAGGTPALVINRLGFLFLGTGYAP